MEKKLTRKGVFIADIEHMPGGVCGIWPAFWMFGPNWPNSGLVFIVCKLAIRLLKNKAEKSILSRESTLEQLIR